MDYTPDEVARLLAERPHQPHYIAAMIRKCIDHAAARAVREAVPDGAVRALRSVANELTATARADCRLSQSSLFHLAKEIHTAIAAPTQDQENGS